jgi:hypothetical protein
MEIKKFAGAVAATSVLFGVGAVAPASATSNIQLFGQQETLKDLNGPLAGYTVTGLMPTSDPVPYPFAGRPYEATVKADAIVGTVTPIVPFFNARAENGDNYRVLANVSSFSGAPIGQGGTSTGKIYFDVVGAEPNSVVFNDGGEDILGWVQPPGVSSAELAPPASSGGGAGESNSGGSAEEGGSSGPNAASPDTSADASGSSDTGGGGMEEDGAAGG